MFIKEYIEKASMIVVFKISDFDLEKIKIKNKTNKIPKNKTT
jgi:hypothetical protein